MRTKNKALKILPFTNCLRWAAVSLTLVIFTVSSVAGIQIAVSHHTEDQASPGFAFTNVPPPSKSDAATAAKFTLVTGEADHGGGLEELHDGKVPAEPDEPGQNFFFAAGSAGGRIQVDLGTAREIKQVNTYSWHPASRGPQVYQLYASDGTAADFVACPGKDSVLEKCGWKPIAKVDTRSPGSEDGGQFGVSISDTNGIIGKYRYFLFNIAPTETEDDFGNTFYSEIDIVELNAPVEPIVSAVAAPMVIHSADGYCEITIDTSKEPALKEWAETKLAPALVEWYPKIVAMMPSEGFEAPKKFSVTIRPIDGVAFTSGTRIVANSAWLQGELKGEAVGSIIHEVVHVVQQYWGRQSPGGQRAPGWLVEGIPDYIRFFKYEPESHGADGVWLQKRKNIKLNYDALYRISANFLDYVVEHYGQDKDLIGKVNAACRQGKYTDDFWQELTGKPLAELNTEWKAAVQPKPAQQAQPSPSTNSVPAHT